MKIPTAAMAGQTPTQLHEIQSRRVEEELEFKLIEGNPLFDVKLPFPSFKASQLRTLINQRLYKVLNILEFNSTRQNMPIIVHDKDGKL
ncbi:hypothetical protein HID58_025715 [Brassica napus]|uniref:Uncharacterized protein n=1 Tax=Brassica napus TaxID=3708 RepID=A0ABQ8CNV6_BRANA|nr:hypothetical protein HID58_036565 [Brassica napus]KAH0918055.1 hypothetical protein HID58_025715 [Brassica napus]